MQEPSGGPSYLNSVAYTAHGAIDNMQLGNLLVEQTCYNDLLQPTDRRLGNATSSNCAIQTSTDLLHLGFDYGASTTNNGNMLQQTIWAPDNGSGSPWQVTQDYTYDQVNRIEKSEEKLGGVLQWSRDYAYDHFGNRWISGNWGHTLHMATPTSQSAIQASTNRLIGTGITYDNAGNLTAHPHITTGSGSMVYDANNKMKSFTATGVAVTTTYDAAARRVRKVYNSETTVWVYDAFGKLAAEYTTESHTDVATYFRTTDHLGSTRLTTDAVGDVVARRDFFPFGERIDSNLSGRSSVLDMSLASYGTRPGMQQLFTGQQRGQETRLDYFWARNYHPPIGRFLSVDPGMRDAQLRSPESWNAFGYVRNNPLRWIDPTGMFTYNDDGNDGDPTEDEDICESEPFAPECGINEDDDDDDDGDADDDDYIDDNALLAILGGHHFLPRQIFGPIQQSNPELYRLFNRWVSGPLQQPHRYDRLHRLYNARVTAIVENFLARLPGNPALHELTRQQGIQLMRTIANDIVVQIYNSTLLTQAGELGSRAAVRTARVLSFIFIVVDPATYDVCSTSSQCDDVIY